MEKLLIITAFFLGFTGSLHCFTMCGPINFIFFSEKKYNIKIIIKSLIYQIGRLTSYIILGMLFSFLGKSFSLIGFHKIISIFIGLFIIFYIFYSKLKIRIIFIDRQYLKFSNFIQKRMIFFIKKRYLFTLFIVGLLNGLLPCGLLYLAITTSISIGNIIYGIMFMLFFGIGTIPIMLLPSLLSDFIKSYLLNNNLIKYITFSLLFFTSILLFLRASGLGIPYISPLDNDITLKKNIFYNCH